MSYFGGILYDPYSDPPPPDDRFPGRQVVDAQVIETWMSAADAREYKIFGEMEFVLRRLAERGWKMRAWAIRRNIKFLRKEALKLGFDWGREEVE